MHPLIIAVSGVLFFTNAAMAQNLAQGRIVSDSSGIQNGIPGVVIYIPSTRELSQTDVSGYFKFTVATEGKISIIARFSVHDSDVFYYDPVSNPKPLLIKDIQVLRTIQIRKEKTASQINSKGIRKFEVLNEGEFKKAACCTLSESFETNNSVEVSNADGISGIRQV